MELKDFELRENLRGNNFVFKTTYGLFSYKKIDEGTKLLIDSVRFEKGGSILDLGCGYGPIGISLAKGNPEGKIYMVDRDFIAVEYAKKNCELNGISGGDVRLSNGFSRLEGLKFDLVVSNLPSHFSNDMLRWILEDAKSHLNPGGRICVVTVSKLGKFIRKEFEKIFGNYKKESFGKMHTVSSAKKAG